MSAQGPLFIGGDGRSGTTLLSVVLDSHPELAVGPELHFRGPENLGGYILDLLELRSKMPALDAWMEVRRDPDLYAGVHFINRCHRFGVAPEVLRLLIERAQADGSSLTTFEERCQLIDMIGRHTQASQGASIWGIKIMRELRIADRYAEVWPDAVFVHIVRDGRDVAASQLREHQGWGYADVQAAARGWTQIVNRADQLAERLPLLQLRYEDLVLDPQTALQPLLDRLGVSWDERMSTHDRWPHALFSHHYGHPSIDTVTQPINDGAIGRFRRDLDEQQVTAFESEAKAELQRHGYALQAWETGIPGD